MINVSSILFVAFLLGMIFELLYVSKDIKLTIKIILYSLLTCLLAFIPFKNEQIYVLADHINKLPLSFSMSVFLFFVILYDDRLIMKLNEGVTFLHSMVFLYLGLELMNEGWLSYQIVLLSCIPISFSFYHAFINKKFKNRDIILLSVWSAFVMFSISGFHVYKLLNIGIEDEFLINGGAFKSNLIFVEYFLLGSAGPYIYKNFTLFFSYLPGKRNFFNAQYFSDIKELNKEHQSRYSRDQVNTTHIFLVLIFVGGLLILNLFYKFLRPSFLIWICLVVVPIVIDKLIINISYKNKDEVTGQ